MFLCSTIFILSLAECAVVQNSLNRFARNAENCIQMNIESDANMAQCWRCRCGCVSDKCLEKCAKKFCHSKS
ncbi:hypothetical protein niasHT_025020 [Heterodera trifolii]|uniref:Uncharacterized protein n=1 Tax=Heterodera trifolii TaxID=157864 RepID=A0ABD2KSU0_9BILA